MKKTFVLALALVVASASASYAQKFGYTNSMALLSELPEMKAADSQLTTFQQMLQKKGQEMVKELQDRAAELQKKEELGTVSPKEAAEEKARLAKKEEEINAYAQQMEQDMVKRREEEYKPILEKVNTAIKDVSKEGSFFMIFDTSTQVLLYADEALDVTSLVKTKLGVPLTPAAGK